MRTVGDLRELLGAALDLALPAVCAGCEEAGHRLCPACARVLGGPARVVVPHPRPPGWPVCWAGVSYEGVTARLVRAYKDGDRRDLAGALGGPLARAVDRALADDAAALRAALAGRLLAVPAPSAAPTRRRRGDLPVAGLARAALAGLGAHEVRLVDALVLRRDVADQAGLGGAARRANLGRAMAVRAGARERVRGASVLVVDDVVTSGSTIAEATRALRAAGAERVLAAAVAAPPWRSGVALPAPPETH